MGNIIRYVGNRNDFGTNCIAGLHWFAYGSWLCADGTTVNGHALSSNVTVSASDLTTGTLPYGQLPALVSGDIPNNAANTTGTAANLSGTPTLPSGTTLPGYPTTGALVAGDYAKASGAGAIADSGVTAGPYSIGSFTVPSRAGRVTRFRGIRLLFGEL